MAVSTTITRLTTLVIVTLTLLVMMTRAAPAPNSKCPKRCLSCSNGVAECSKRSLVSPPKDFPLATQKIVLDDNHVRVLGARTFQTLPSLEVLRMKGNKVRVVKSGAFKKLPALMTLDLSNNQLVKIYARGFEGMDQLQTLSLQKNKLRSAARIFDNTPKLYQLNLAFNRLRSIGPNDFQAPTRIHYLDLRNNRLASLHPQAFAHLRLLRYLFLNQNPLVTVPDLTFGSQVLQLVDFSNCRLTHVPRTMPPSVSDFRLSDNKIMHINDTDFANMTHLRLLALNNNELHFVGNKALAGLTGLEEVWLRNNRLAYIPRGLPDNLRKLYMDANKIRQIEDGLFTNASRLDYLTVENNRIHTIHNATFSGLRFLRSLNLQGNKLRVLERGTFKSLGNLTTLSLSNNPLERVEEGAFQELHNLTSLHLDMCGESTVIESNFLTQMPALEKLSMLNSPGLGEAFVEMIASASDPSSSSSPPTLTNLTELDLAYNDLHTLTSDLRAAFPGLRLLALDGNSWTCDRRLVWLKQWMVSSDDRVSFSKYVDVVCENPYGLKGRRLRDVADDDFAPVAPPTPQPSQEDYSKMLAQMQALNDASASADSSSSSSSSSVDGPLPSPAAMHDSSAVLKIGPKPEEPIANDSPASQEGEGEKKRKRKKSRRNNNRKQRKSKGKGRKKRNKSGGKGRKRRSKKNRKAREAGEAAGQARTG